MHTDNIKKYYSLVDQNKFEELTDLFSDDIVYNRAGLVIKGKKEFLNFYANTRTIKGSHTINKILGNSEVVVVQGDFNFIDYRITSFVDIFSFDHHGKIKERETYLLSGSEDIQ
ncbi:MAG: nuclear transport factor 2 family protein [Candidatus Vogelbacteria bacterium]|nr:nuclear transport factor 2 family protein [Candidatus Vogelbacteria bacterium]